MLGAGGGEVVAARADPGAEALGERVEPCRRAQAAGGRADLGVRGVGGEEAEVLRDRSVEDVDLLADQDDPAAQDVRREFRERDAVQQDAAGVGGRTPARILASVVLPAPLAPTTATVSPGSTVRETASSARRPAA